MEMELTRFKYLPCQTETFTINGINADQDDFGEGYDTLPERSRWSCGNWQFFPKPHTQEILDKYKITKEEYDKICALLIEELYVGPCMYCE